MTALADFRPEVLADLPGIAFPSVDRAIRHAAIELCDFAFVWRVSLTAKDIAPGVATYSIDASPCGRVVTVMHAHQNGLRLLPTNESELDSSETGWRLPTSRAAVSTWYYLPDRQTIRLVLTPDIAQSASLEVSVALKPTQGATDLAQVLYDDYLETIGHGARARLLATNGAEWANPQLAGYHKAEFERLKRKHRAEVLNAFTRESRLRFVPHNYQSSWQRPADRDCD